MSSTYRLGSGLGNAFSALANGDAIQNDAYNVQTRQNLDDALLQGKVDDQRARSAAYASMPGDLEKMGIPAGQGGAYTDVALATGSKANEVGQMFKTLLQAGYLKGAQDAAAKGNTLGANFQLAAGGEKPVVMTDVKDNTAYNPNVAPSGQTLQTTPYGKESLNKDASTKQPKTFVGQDGVLRIIHPDGNADVVKDRSGNPVMADDVSKASSVYSEIFKDSLNKPSFEDWFNKGWPKIRATTTTRSSAVPPPKAAAAPGGGAGASPAAGVATAHANISKALQDAVVAIKAGAPREQVKARLVKMGARPEQLKAAGFP